MGTDAFDSSTEVTYDDLGGLKKEIKLLREFVELPLRFPHVFKEVSERLSVSLSVSLLLSLSLYLSLYLSLSPSPLCLLFCLPVSCCLSSCLFLCLDGSSTVSSLSLFPHVFDGVEFLCLSLYLSLSFLSLSLSLSLSLCLSLSLLSSHPSRLLSSLLLYFSCLFSSVPLCI